jgi:hypothetical protein
VHRAIAHGPWLRGVESAVAQADGALVAAGIVALGGLALVCAWLAWRALHRLRLIADTPTSKARSAHQGYVELEGIARPMDAPLTARLSHLPCCWYRYRIEELETVGGVRGETRRRWRTIDQGASTDTFWLDDGTGRVAVDPEGAELRARYRDVWQGASLASGINASTPVRRSVLFGSGNRYRFTEERIIPGEPLYALGLLKNLGVDLNAPTTEDRMRELLRSWKNDRAGLHERFDLNKDGRIDEQEWLLARQAARRQAEKARAKVVTRLDEGVNLLCRPLASGLPYLISAYTQQELARRKRLRAALYAAGFFLAGMLAVWIHNVRFA